MKFQEWANYREALLGYVSAGIMLFEGRRDLARLQSRRFSGHPSLFDMPDEGHPWRKPSIIDPAAKSPDGEKCENTPLSGYETHIKAIQSYAFASPENFAQVLMFSPLSGNAPFPKHWDNFHVLMSILKHKYPDRVDEKELEQVLDSFEDYLHAIPHTIHGWKLKTIAYVWNNREELMGRLTALTKEGDDEDLIRELVKVPGVAPVKAGFITQLLFGRAGCIDTHNIDIYSKAFPDLAAELVPQKWGDEKGTKAYMKVLDQLKKRGIGTKQLWDVWVDFVENFYKYMTSHKLGTYTHMGSAIDNPDAPEYEPLKQVTIPKLGATKGGRGTEIRPISGKAGMGASATHLPIDPDEALGEFEKIYRRGEAGSQAARAIPFRTTRTGKPIDVNVGLGTEPSLLRYFGPALRRGEVDPDIVRDIIQRRMEKGGKKARRARAAWAQKTLGFKEWMGQFGFQEELGTFLKYVSAQVLSSMRKVGDRVAITFPKMGDVGLDSPERPGEVETPAFLAAHTLYEVGRPKLPGSEEERRNRHKKGWQVYKSLSSIADPEEFGWTGKERGRFKRTVTANIGKAAQPIGFLFEIIVFQYLIGKGFYNPDQNDVEIEKLKQEHIQQIGQRMHTSTQFVVKMVEVHARDLGNQIESKVTKLLGCADMVWFVGGGPNWEKRRVSPADLYVGCSHSTDRSGFSLKFGSETRVHIASLSPISVLRLLGQEVNVSKDYLRQYGVDQVEDQKEWAALISELIADAARPLENDPGRFTDILNYLLTGNKKVIPAVRNYASTDVGGVGWSGNMQKDFVISKRLDKPLKPRPEATVTVDSTATYARATYKVEGGSFSGTTIYFIPRDGKINVKVNNLTSSRR